MKNEKIYSVGQSVTWADKKETCEGSVRDDLGQTTVMINVLVINGEKLKAPKIKLIKRELLNIKKEDKMAKVNVEKILLQGKYKKYSKKQLLDKVKKVEGFEQEVIIEILKNRGVSTEEIGITNVVLEPEVVEEVKVEEVVETQPEVEVVVKKEEKAKHSTLDNGTHVVEFEQEEEIEEKIEESNKNKKIITNVEGKNKNKFGHLIGSKADIIDQIFILGKEPLSVDDILKISDNTLKISKIKDHIRHLIKDKGLVEKIGDKFKLV